MLNSVPRPDWIKLLIANSWLQENKILLQSLGGRRKKKIYLLKNSPRNVKEGTFPQ